MMDPRNLVLVGKPLYYWSHLATVAREFARRFGEPVRGRWKAASTTSSATAIWRRIRCRLTCSISAAARPR